MVCRNTPLNSKYYYFNRFLEEINNKKQMIKWVAYDYHNHFIFKQRFSFIQNQVF